MEAWLPGSKVDKSINCRKIIFCMVVWDNIPGNSPGNLYAVMLLDSPSRSGPVADGGRSDTVPHVLAVGPGTCPMLLEAVGAVNTGGVTAAEAGTVRGGIAGGDHG